MGKHQIEQTNIENIRSWEGVEYLDNDLFLTNHIDKMIIHSEPRLLNFILLVLCNKGQITFNLDMNDVTLKTGDLMIVTERHVISGYSASDDVDGICIAVTTNFFHEVIQNVSDISSLFIFARTHSVTHLAAADRKTFKEYFAIVNRKIADTNNTFRKPLVRTLMLAMFYDLSHVVGNYNRSTIRQTRVDDIFTKYVTLVEANCREQRRVSWYAQQLCITPKYLSETIKSASLHTPNYWIDNYVIMAIRVELKNTTKSIKEIAKDMNFPNQSFFGKYFKEHVGISPTEYRKSL